MSDPVSGLFGFRREVFQPLPPDWRGYKLLLFLLVMARGKRVDEVGFRFEPRGSGASKVTQNSRFIRFFLTELLPAKRLEGRPPSKGRRSVPCSALLALGVGTPSSSLATSITGRERPASRRSPCRRGDGAPKGRSLYPQGVNDASAHHRAVPGSSGGTSPRARASAATRWSATISRPRSSPGIRRSLRRPVGTPRPRTGPVDRLVESARRRGGLPPGGPSVRGEGMAVARRHLRDERPRERSPLRGIAPSSSPRRGLPGLVGRGVRGGRPLPMREEAQLRPVNPYGVSKACQDMLSLQYALNFDLRIVRGRLFITTGPGKPGTSSTTSPCAWPSSNGRGSPGSFGSGIWTSVATSPTCGTWCGPSGPSSSGIDAAVLPAAQSWDEAAAMAVVPPAPPPADPPERLARSIARGRELFGGTAAQCAKCHGPAGDGRCQPTELYDDWNRRKLGATPAETRRLAGRFRLPVERLRPRNFTLGVFHGGDRPIDQYWRICVGIKGTPMPAAGPAPGSPAHSRPSRSGTW